jgi:hypothetical protein
VTDVGVAEAPSVCFAHDLLGGRFVGYPEDRDLVRPTLVLDLGAAEALPVDARQDAFAWLRSSLRPNTASQSPCALPCGHDCAAFGVDLAAPAVVTSAKQTSVAKRKERTAR